MLHDFDEWSAKQVETHAFSSLKDTIIAIDADFYLSRVLNEPPSQEKLLSAHGGLPFSIRHYTKLDLEELKKASITPIFVFNGLEVGEQYRPFSRSDQAAQACNKAWSLYEQQKADESVEAFGSSRLVQPRDLYRLLQTILLEHKVAFQVAPYSALAQLAYLDSFHDMVDIVAASSEIFLYDVEKAIVKLDFQHHEVTWVKRKALVDEYGGTVDKFKEACLLSGSSILPPLPQLQSTKPMRIRQALDLMRRTGDSGHGVCLNLSEQEKALEGVKVNEEYLDRYRRTWMAIKHHVVLKLDGRVEPLDLSNAPSDFYEFIGQRLPDELYFYLSRGVLSPRILNWLTSQQIIELAPRDGGESEEYRSLVSEKLLDIRTSALSMLSHSLTRAYQHRTIILRCWFDPSREIPIRLSDLPAPRNVLDTWNVREAAFVEHSDFQPETPSLKFALHSLTDEAFAAKTITSKRPPNLLETKTEIQYNTMWRFLHLRGYISDDHTLTPWGKVLHAMQSKLNPTKVHEDAPLLAVELLRMGLLGTGAMFATYTPVSTRGSETDRRNNLIVGRIATLGKLRHEPTGYTGPLSRYLLAHSCLANAVRCTLRDLLEMCLATLLLNGDAARTPARAADLPALGLALQPLLLAGDAALGIAVHSYLNEVSGGLHELASGKERAREAGRIREATLAKGARTWFLHAEAFEEDLKRGFDLWDAVVEGVRVAGGLGLVADVDDWEALDAWLTERR